jgi:hypothetical protein
MPHRDYNELQLPYQWRAVLPRRSPAWPAAGVRGTPMIQGWCLSPARIQAEGACGSWIVLA